MHIPLIRSDLDSKILLNLTPQERHIPLIRSDLDSIKVCFCLQKRMSPPIPQTVVIGKKSIWVTNKIKLQ
jgi:hypothetical protein